MKRKAGQNASEFRKIYIHTDNANDFGQEVKAADRKLQLLLEEVHRHGKHGKIGDPCSEHGRYDLALTEN